MELEFKVDQNPRFFKQILTYLTLLYRKYMQVVVVVVIYSGKRKNWGLPATFREYLRRSVGGYVSFLDDMILDYGYLLVNLHNLDIKHLMQKAPAIGPGLFIASRIHGLEQGREEIIISLLQSGTVDDATICKVAKITKNKLARIKKKINK